LKTPVGGIDREAAQPGTLVVLGASHRDVESAGRFSRRAGPGFRPGDRQRFLLFVDSIVVVTAQQRLSVDQRLALSRQTLTLWVGSINIGRSPDIFDALEDGMVLRRFDENASGRIGVPIAVFPLIS